MDLKWFAVGLVLLTGCGTTATINTRSESPFDGTIIGGNSEEVRVHVQNHVRTIPRNQIEDIDHPGNVAATIGGVVTGYGIVNIAIGAPECDRQGPAFCMGVFIPAAVGLPLMIWGITTYVGSVRALNKAPNEVTAQRFFVVPTTQVAGQPQTPGLVAGGSF
jgi:hypothetical protein